MKILELDFLHLQEGVGHKMMRVEHDSMTYEVIWNYFGKDWRQFWKTNIFFTQGSPLWFSGDLSTRIWAKGWFYF